MKVKARVKPGEALRCKGRIKPSKKGASFCWKIREEKLPSGKEHRVEFVSRRSGKPFGFLGINNDLVKTREEAKKWDYLNKFAAEYEAERFFVDAKSKRRYPWVKSAREGLKAIKKEAQKGGK